MRTLCIGSTTFELGDKKYMLEYSVVSVDLFSENNTPAGESYGVCVKKSESLDGGGLIRWAETEIVRDITTKHKEILDFAETIKRLLVTPATLRDVVYDCLPL